MIQRNKYQAILTKARRYKFRPRPRLRFVTMDFVSEPGIGNGGDDGRWSLSEPGMSGIHHNGKVVKMVATGSIDRTQHASEEAIKLGALGNPNANSRKYELYPHQQSAADALNELSLKHTGTPVEELDYFNIWTQGIASGFFDRDKLAEMTDIPDGDNLYEAIAAKLQKQGKTIMIDSMSEAVDNDTNGYSAGYSEQGKSRLAEFIESNIKFRAEAKKKILDFANAFDIPTGFGPINKMLDGGFKPGELIFTGAAPLFGMSRHLNMPFELRYGSPAYGAMEALKRDFKKANPEATNEAMFAKIHEDLAPMQRGALFIYHNYLRKTLEAGVVEEIKGAVDAMVEVYNDINQYVEYVRNNNLPTQDAQALNVALGTAAINIETPESITKAVESMRGMHRSVGEPVANGRLPHSGLQEYKRLAAEKLTPKPLDNLCAQFPGDLGDEPKEDKKDV